MLPVWQKPQRGAIATAIVAPLASDANASGGVFPVEITPPLLPPESSTPSCSVSLGRFASETTPRSSGIA
jgi:hypothetical protein